MSQDYNMRRPVQTFAQRDSASVSQWEFGCMQQTMECEHCNGHGPSINPNKDLHEAFRNGCLSMIDMSFRTNY